jgi:DNA-binding transcriptional ArsR family regulator
MLDTLITSKTRVKLLLKFFLNSHSRSYLRNLETEFGESTNAIRVELNRFEEAGLLTAKVQGNRKYFSANTTHPLFPEINSIVRKYIDNVIQNLGGLEKAYITGDLALGRDTKKVELLLIGEGIDTDYLDRLARKAEEIIKRKISYRILGRSPRRAPDNSLLIWETSRDGEGSQIKNQESKIKNQESKIKP